MQLVYIWGSEKRIPEKIFELNLSNRYVFNFDENEGTISTKVVNNYIEGFFHKNITITAIIGKNGSGKTTTLSNIKHSIIDDFSYDKVIKIYKKNSSSYIVFWKDLSTLRFLEGNRIFASKSFPKTPFASLLNWLLLILTTKNMGSSNGSLLPFFLWGWSLPLLSPALFGGLLSMVIILRYGIIK